MTGCANPKPVEPPPPPEIHNIYPSVPTNFLSCTDEPVPGQILTDIQAAQFADALRIAGADCRDRLAKVKGIVDGWPK